MRGLITLTTIASLSIIGACSFPDVSIDKNKNAALGGHLPSFSSSSFGSSEPSKRYLATVHIRFSDSTNATPLSFDIRKDKRSMIAAQLFGTETTSTILHLGYTRNDGPVTGVSFSWRF